MVRKTKAIDAAERACIGDRESYLTLKILRLRLISRSD
jgi:hypothetical protein